MTATSNTRYPGSPGRAWGGMEELTRLPLAAMPLTEGHEAEWVRTAAGVESAERGAGPVMQVCLGFSV